MTFNQAMILYATALIYISKGHDPATAACRAAQLVEALNDVENRPKKG